MSIPTTFCWSRNGEWAREGPVRVSVNLRLLLAFHSGISLHLTKARRFWLFSGTKGVGLNEIFKSDKKYFQADNLVGESSPKELVEYRWSAIFCGIEFQMLGCKMWMMFTWYLWLGSRVKLHRTGHLRICDTLVDQEHYLKSPFW